MIYLFKEWERLRRVLAGRQIALFLDYDGTLTPIAGTPQKAVLSPGVRSLLVRLSGAHHCRTAIISGRALDNIKAMVGVDKLIYAGNHGLEIEGPDIKYKSRSSQRMQSVITEIRKILEDRLGGIKGVLLEDKGLTLSLHYRLADEKDAAVICSIFKETVRPYLEKNRIKILSGKKVFEIRPAVEWDKGKVALWLLARQYFGAGDKKVIPVYVGDDATDEDAFKALKKKGLTVFVGAASAPSRAKYYLKDTAEVVKLLGKIMELEGQ